jgi:hypothetical protein
MFAILTLFGLIPGLFLSLIEGFVKLIGAFTGVAPALVLAITVGGCLTGCLQPNMDPIERGMNTMVVEVIKPAVAKAGEELSARTAQLQGQGSLINPGYTVEGFASVGPATTFKFTIRAEGVSANLAAAAQGDAGQAGTQFTGFKNIDEAWSTAYPKDRVKFLNQHGLRSNENEELPVEPPAVRGP